MDVTTRSVASVIALALAAGCRSTEDARFFEAFDAIPIGTPQEEVILRLGSPNDSGATFRLSQLAGFEEQYRQATASRSVRYLFWHRDIDVLCALGLDADGRTSYKACGGT